MRTGGPMSNHGSRWTGEPQAPQPAWQLLSDRLSTVQETTAPTVATFSRTQRQVALVVRVRGERVAHPNGVTLLRGKGSALRGGPPKNDALVSGEAFVW